MKFEQALQVVQAEVTSASVIGRALAQVLEHMELAAYREARRHSDVVAKALKISEGDGIRKVAEAVTVAPQTNAALGPVPGV
jgi:hypothetical protein